MKGVRSLLKTTAIRLSLIYASIFGLLAVAIIFYMTGSTIKIFEAQIETSINAEVLELEQVFIAGGVNRLVVEMERRSRGPGANLYIVTNPAGVIIAGNVANIQSGVLDQVGWTGKPFQYSKFNNTQSNKYLAIARVVEISNGMHFLIGRDISQSETFGKVVKRALIFSLVAMVVLGLATWFFVGRRALKRIDMVSKSTNRILAGDRSERLPLSGGGDEFDRLSSGMNDMLDQINHLDKGLKQVSDNIAHDLKTPITRLRNKAETALTGKMTAANGRKALASVVEECDILIKTFDALLMIARVESGSTTAKFTRLNLSKILVDIVELYEPLAEESVLDFKTDIAVDIMVSGNRELLSQAMANLIDNAMKYSTKKKGEQTSIQISLQRNSKGALISVSDNGPGIPEDKRDHVMKRFTRLEKSRTRPGNGLGLSLVKAVVQLHKGTIVLGDNQPGLVVTMSFPTI
ncbi:MAG: two-component sensor histidine kinase [Hyphomicrobiales bacterium]|nr:MAG: two-component sensor histidine kinase [Hyphomicrobiales bacterium]